MKMKVKKGQAIGSLQALIGPLLGIGLTLVIAFLIFTGFQDNATDLAESNSDADNVTWTNNTYVALTYSPDSADISCTAVYNGTNGTYDADRLIGATNYTCTTSGINILISDETNQSWNASVRVEYNYKASAAVNGTREVTNATQQIAGWLPIMVLIIIGTIVVSLIALWRRRG